MISYNICLSLTFNLASVQFSSVAQSCPTLWDPMNRSTPGLPVHHQLPEFTQTHVHPVGNAIQPSHALSSPSPPAPNPSQHQERRSLSIMPSKSFHVAAFFFMAEYYCRWSTPKSDWLYSLQPKMKKLYTVSKNKTGSWLWLRSWTPYCQIQA